VLTRGATRGMPEDTSAAKVLGTLLGILRFHLIVTVDLIVTERGITHATDALFHKQCRAPFAHQARTIRGGRRQAHVGALTGNTGSRGHIVSSAVDGASAKAGGT
jgi:hypothetical protein